MGIDEERKRIEISINCDKNLQPASKAIRERLPVLSIPPEIVEVTAGKRSRPDVLWHNKLEECEPPHPAGFGGFFHTGESTFYVYLLHPSQKAAEEIMSFQLSPSRWDKERTVHPLQGDFTYTQLEDWYGHFLEDWYRRFSVGEASEYSELVALAGYVPKPALDAGVSPKLNRILFQISPEADGDAIRKILKQRLTELNIPLEAVIIEVGQLAREYNAPTLTLMEKGIFESSTTIS